MNPFFVVLLAALAYGTFHFWRASRHWSRIEYIRNFKFPPGLFDKLREKHPTLDLKACQLTARALREFFLAYLKSGCRLVAMPTQVTDDLWHEFILYTRHYADFCHKAFGGFLHHTPAAALGERAESNEGLRRVWWHACMEETINPSQPTRLPLLFAIDAKLNIAGGFFYVPDCEEQPRTGDARIHCASDFKSSRIDGTLNGFGPPVRRRTASAASCGGGGGCSAGSAGCGGGGCGGGCGGG